MQPTEALIIVDVQNDFCPGGALPVPNGDQVVIPLNALIASGRGKENILLTASYDWHPADSNHFKKWPIHCVQHTHGALTHPGLDLRGVYPLFKGKKKHEDGYSAEPEFIKQLTGMKITAIKKVSVGGLALDYCVKATAIDLAKAGFETYVIIDATRAVNIHPDDGDNAIKEIEKAGVKFVKTMDLLIHWNKML